MRRILFFATAVALVVVACGGEAETETFASTPTETVASGSQNDLIEAITANALANPDRRIDDDAVACVARGVVDDFGEDGLAALGVTAESPDLAGGGVFATPDAARRVVDIGMQCIDIPGAIAAFLPEGVNLLDNTVGCVADQLRTETFRDLFAELVVVGAEPADILGDADAQIPIATLLASCLSPEEILQLGDLLN